MPLIPSKRRMSDTTGNRDRNHAYRCHVDGRRYITDPQGVPNIWPSIIVPLPPKPPTPALPPRSPIRHPSAERKAEKSEHISCSRMKNTLPLSSAASKSKASGSNIPRPSNLPRTSTIQLKRSTSLSRECSPDMRTPSKMREKPILPKQEEKTPSKMREKPVLPKQEEKPPLPPKQRHKPKPPGKPSPSSGTTKGKDGW